MCTSITFTTKNHYFGRNLDYEFSYGEEIAILPRNYPLSFRYLGEKKEINVIPYNILYFEAAEENKVADLFLRLKKNLIKEDRLDDNYLFMQAVEDFVNKILRKLQELQKKMR